MPPERYRILRRVGSGGVGVVYAAFYVDREHTIALKTLLRVNRAAIYRFKKEFRALTDVAHLNLISLYDLVVDDQACFFTMELVDGADFLTHVRPSPTHVDQWRLRLALVQLVEGCVLHDAAIAHCDIKPSNVLVDRSGRTVILDFGLALDSSLTTTDGGGHLIAVGTTWELSSAQNFVLGSLMYLGDLREVRRRLPGLIEDALERANLYRKCISERART